MRTALVSIMLIFSLIVLGQNPASERRDTANNSAWQFEGWNPEYGCRHLVYPRELPDSSDMFRHQKKNFWRAGAETVGFNVALWAFDRYVLDGSYAHISWNSIKENFRHGFEWDDDYLNTNMFSHPYNGSLFFNAGRSNGYNFWQSELFAIGGSAMWELFMECEYPSINDIIATPIGGAAIGEVLYRTSDLILDDRSSGGERFGREAAAFLIDPMRGLTRIFTGDAWKRRPATGRRFGIPPISVELSAGARVLALWNDNDAVKAGFAAEINIEYGDRFSGKTKAPYDYFSFLMEIQTIKTQPVLSRAEIIGRLLSREIVDKTDLKATIGMYQHFDFFDSDTIRKRRPGRNPVVPCVVPYKLGAPASLGAGVMAQYAPSERFVFDGYVHANGLLLAGILTDFYRDYHRNYNWGYGFSLKTGLNAFLFKNRLIVSVADRFYRIMTWQGFDQSVDWTITRYGKPLQMQGDGSNATFNHLEATLKFRLRERLYLSAGCDFYWRTSNYNGLKIRDGSTLIENPIVRSKQIGSHLMVSYVL